jgi:SAM-dependent methyltransferase
MDKKLLVEEYNQYFTDKPDKWVGGTRNVFAFTHIPITPESILDVGCGNGHTLAYFASVYPVAELAGIDISQVACQIARENVPDAKIHEGFIEDVILGRFDLVLCMGTAEHFLDLHAGLKALKRCLRYGGVCLFRSSKLPCLFTWPRRV